MPCDVVTFPPGDGYWELVRRGATVLRNGGLLILPTETVYGVAARADDPLAVERLRRIKHRESRKPFTVHIGRREEAFRYVPDPGRLGRRWIRKAWPGPLTLLFRVADPGAAPIAAQVDRVAALALYHEGVIGLRCPDDDRARDVLNEAGVPVVAASANLANRPPPRSVEEAMKDLGEGVDLALDGGTARLSTPSTVVYLDEESFSIVRRGVHDERTLRKMATLGVLFVCTGNTCRSPMASAMFRRMLAERLGGEDQIDAHDLEVHSAGTAAAVGGRASAEAVEVMSRRGIDLSGHRSQPLSVELIRDADYIFTMTPEHRRAVLSLSPTATERCRSVGEEPIEDPLGRSAEVYEVCADRLERCLRERLEEVQL